MGRMIFPRRQEWEQRRNAKIVFGVVSFSLILGLTLAKLMKMIYIKTKVG